MTLRVLSLARSTSLPLVLLLLVSCAPAPVASVQIETREVLVPVRTPLPEECFVEWKAPALSQTGALTFREFEQWVDGAIAAIESYQVQAQRCRELNVERQPAPP